MANCIPLGVPPAIAGERDLYYALHRLVADSYRSRRGDIYGPAQPAYPELAGASFYARGNRRLWLASWMERHWAEPFGFRTGHSTPRHTLLARWHGHGRSETVCSHWGMDWSHAVDVRT